MKKICTILFLLVYFYTQIGYFWQFLVYQQLLRERAREAWLSTLPDAQFRRLGLDEVNASGKWQDGGRECWYKEHLYDVIRQRTIGGKTYLFCMDDRNEARLIKKSGETKPSPGFPGKLNVVLLPQCAGDNITTPAAVDDRGGSLPCNALPVRYREVVFPPPRA
ncbi:hypothetical protein [Dinghuibacter silviterrae]|uniref:Uncharacterized protein n=1 Tax=Dinghuibacter silviterrae TaxID=1539049 RepID=A0A4R8DES9_9BACT|nr:hypothetical protein [Dinghuibacter silviterrae]TDW95768.1 hypothetical protein EDB95_3579 [Dinghuibacter silviterrae]